MGEYLVAVQAKYLKSVAVKEEAIRGEDGLAEANVAGEFMSYLAIDGQGRDYLIEFWGIRRPQLDIRGRYIERESCVSGLGDSTGLSDLRDNLSGVLEL